MNQQKVTRALDMTYVLRQSAWSLIFINFRVYSLQFLILHLLTVFALILRQSDPKVYDKTYRTCLCNRLSQSVSEKKK